MLSEEEKTIQFYKRFIEVEEQELEWMYKEDEEYYRDSIEQKELLIKGWRNILNFITKLQKDNKEKDKTINKMASYIGAISYDNIIEKLKDDDIAYYGVDGAIKEYFKQKATKNS